jgi:hypothetical protein
MECFKLLSAPPAELEACGISGECGAGACMENMKVSEGKEDGGRRRRDRSARVSYCILLHGVTKYME